jgi:serine protease Do
MIAAAVVSLGLHVPAWSSVVGRAAPPAAICGWTGVRVSPITAAFADSLGMAVPYGGIFERPESGSPAAEAGIEAGDVITSIEGSPLMKADDFATIIAAMSPGTIVHLSTWRDGQLMEKSLTLGSGRCPAPRKPARLLPHWSS